jgi:hypothetical protein
MHGILFVSIQQWRNTEIVSISLHIYAHTSQKMDLCINIFKFTFQSLYYFDPIAAHPSVVEKDRSNLLFLNDFDDDHKCVYILRTSPT